MAPNYRQPPPNMLGRALHYFSSALAYSRNEFKPEKAQRGRPVGFGAAILRPLAEESASGLIDSGDAEKLAITSYAVFSAINITASSVARKNAWPQAMLREGENLREVYNHPWEQLIRHPNDLMSYDYIVKYLTFWYMLRGNAYLFISTPQMGRGEPEELWPLPANLVSPRPDTLRRSRLTGQLTIDYYITFRGEKKPLNGENIFHWRTVNPWDYWEGLSPLTAGIGAIREGLGYDDWVETFFTEDRAVPAAILSLPPSLSDGEFEVAKEAIREEYGSGHKSAIVRAGDLSIEVVQSTIEELEVHVGRAYARDIVHQIYGIPEGLIAGSLATENLYAVLHSFAINVTQPLLDSMAAQWTLDIVPFYEDNLEIVAPNIVPQDKSIRLQEFGQYSKVMTGNEARSRLDPPLPPLKLTLYEEVPRELYPMLSAPGGADILTSRVGTLIGSESPKRLTNRLAEQGEGADTGPQDPEEAGRNKDEDNKAWQRAVRDELKCWRRVALSELGKGRNPAEREFATVVIPESLKLSVMSRLHETADDDTIKAIFTDASSCFNSTVLPREEQDATTEDQP